MIGLPIGRGFGDVGTDAIPFRPEAAGVALDTGGCPGTYWVNNSVTNSAGTNRNCLVDYATGQTIQVDPATGVDAAGRPFWCHMANVAGQSPGNLPWICGTPAQRAATPDLATYRKQKGIPDPNDPNAYWTSAPPTMDPASVARAQAELGAPGGTPPPLPIPILQQIQDAISGGSQIITPAPSPAPASMAPSILPAGLQLLSLPSTTSTAVATPAAIDSSTLTWLGLAAAAFFALKFL
jgi:hypothetical protein